MGEKTNGKKGLKGYYLTTFLIGLGFFTMGLMDPLYDTYIPIFLGKYISSMSLVGVVMALDNVLAVFMIPIFSALSDKTDTKIGRRMPYIVTCLPLAAICFALIPLTAIQSFWLLIALIVLLNIFKQAVRGPVVALMPDIVPADLRSEANGVINTMGGLATILGTVLLARLMNVYVHIPGRAERVNDILAFPVASIFVIIAVILLAIFIKEKKMRVVDSSSEDEKKEPVLASLVAIFKEKEKSALFILLSLFCWFMAYQGILPFVGQYSVQVLRTSSGTASLAAGMVGIAYAIFAVPSGKVAHRFGRKRTIRFSLCALVIILAAVALHGFVLSKAYPVSSTPIEQLEEGEFGGEVAPLEKGVINSEERAEEAKKPSSLYLYSFWALLFLFGIFWVSVVTNSFPMLWQMADYKTMGIYTGVYYLFSQLSSIISPSLAGSVIDLAGYPALFLYGVVFMAIAFFLMRRVKRGEPESDVIV